MLKRLKVLYLGNNLIKEWVEFNRLQELTTLETLVFVGNPLMEATAGGDEATTWRSECARRLPNLKKLDGETIVAEMVDQLQSASGSGPATAVAAATATPASPVAS